MLQFILAFLSLFGVVLICASRTFFSSQWNHSGMWYIYHSSLYISQCPTIHPICILSLCYVHSLSDVSLIHICCYVTLLSQSLVQNSFTCTSFHIPTQYDFHLARSPPVRGSERVEQGEVGRFTGMVKQNG